MIIKMKVVCIKLDIYNELTVGKTYTTNNHLCEPLPNYNRIIEMANYLYPIECFITLAKFTMAKYIEWLLV